MEEYFKFNHAERLPPEDLEKPVNNTFYLPMHPARKEHSTTTKLRVVFDTSAKSASGVLLNNMLFVGHTIHPSLVDVLLRPTVQHLLLISVRCTEPLSWSLVTEISTDLCGERA